MHRLTIAACVALMSVSAFAASPSDLSAADATLTACLARNGTTVGVDNCNAMATAAANRRLNEIYAGLVDKLKHPAGPDDARDNPEILNA